VLSATLLLLVLSQQAPATCVSEYGLLRCGYDCKARYGQVACAQTPLGACAAEYGQVVCADPPLWVFPWLAENSPKMECKSAYGQVVCGFQCRAAFGQVACAQTPFGTCHAERGRVQCFESPTPWLFTPLPGRSENTLLECAWPLPFCLPGAASP
jgi:hypothetical protein